MEGIGVVLAVVKANLLLASLPADDLALLRPFLQPMDLPLRFPMDKPGKRVEFCYFVTQGIASVVAKGGKKEIETGFIGHEGVSGLTATLTDAISGTDTYMQVAGAGLRMSASRVREARAKIPAFSQALDKYVHFFLIQSMQTALVNGQATVEVRLARWLLMAADRVGPTIEITHEFLSVMLGVRRAGVTGALHILEGDKLIRSRRKMVLVKNRIGLETLAGWTYGTPEAHYAQVFRTNLNGNLSFKEPVQDSAGPDALFSSAGK